jgi:hypothetical protein
MIRRWSFLLALILPLSIAAEPRAQSKLRAPEFTVDPAWPSIPNNWVLGEVTSISVDSKDHIWVLHVPQSIPEAQRRTQRRQCSSSTPGKS